MHVQAGSLDAGPALHSGSHQDVPAVLQPSAADAGAVLPYAQHVPVAPTKELLRQVQTLCAPQRCFRSPPRVQRSGRAWQAGSNELTSTCQAVLAGSGGLPPS